MRPTDEQSAAIDAAPKLQPGEVLKLIAFAGAGKTTTLTAIARAMNKRGGYLAFNKSIASEAQVKLSSTRCRASTMHSLAYRAMKDIMGSPAYVNANSLKDSGIMSRHRFPRVKGWGEYRLAAAATRAISEYCNSADEKLTTKHVRAALINSVGDPDFIIGDQKRKTAEDALGALTEPLTALARAYWDRCIDDNRYSHDMYLKALDLDENIRRDALRGLHYLMVDEAQDINPVQRSILVKSGLPLIAVGDPYQQIYSWRGAENALAQMPGKELYLTQSFRFGENIASQARTLLAHRPDGGPEKKLTGLGPGNIKEHVGPTVFTICRTNIGMLEEGMRAIERGYKTHVDKMDDLIDEVRSAQALYEGRLHEVSSPDMKQFDDWTQVEEAAEAGDSGLNKIVKLITQNRVGFVEKLNATHVKAASDAQVLICTGHASKGLEAPAVRMGDDWSDIVALKKRHKKAQEKSDKHVTLVEEEFNLLYVAATRAMQQISQLHPLINPDPKPDPDFQMDSQRSASPS